MNKHLEDIQIDLKDLIAALLAKAGIIILCMVILGATALGYSVLKKGNSNSGQSLEARTAEARSQLSTYDAEMTENIYEQYLSYMKYKESLQDYYNSYVFFGEDFTDYIRMTSLYNINTSINGAEKIITTLAISQNTYDQICGILAETDSNIDVYKQVHLSSTLDENAVLNYDVIKPNNYLIAVTVIAKSSDQCDRISALVGNDILKQIKVLQTLDPEAELFFVGNNYIGDVSAWLVERQTEAINQLINIDNIIMRFTDEKVNVLSPKQKAYYDLLIGADTGEGTSGLSVKTLIKYLLFGLICGAAIPCGCVLIKYIFKGDIKTAGDISSRYGISILNTISFGEKKHLLFNKWIKDLKGLNKGEPDKELKLACSDIQVMMDKDGKESLYLIKTSGTEEEKVLTEQLIEGLHEANETLIVDAGEPLDDANALKNMAGSDYVVFVVETEKTSMEKMDRYFDLLTRYGSRVLGSLIINKG